MNRTTLLIVEDEAIVGEDLAGKVRRLGYEVIGIAASGEEALSLAERLHPQLVLMDIQLEGALDGIEAAQKIKDLLDVPVIYLTAHSDAATLSRAKTTEPFGYILKPFEERDLAVQIELALYKHQADRQMREQREWLRVTLTSIGDAVIAADTNCRISFINPVAAALTGWSTQEAVGRAVSEVFKIFNEQTGIAVEDPVARVLNQGRAVSLANHTALITRFDSKIPIEDSAAPILDADGQVIGAVLVFHDVTDKRKAEQDLLRINETLERQVADRSALLETRARQLQALAVELIEAEERERRRVAELLHDDLQQILAAARFQLQGIDKDPRDSSSEPVLANVQRMLEESIEKSRRLSHELSPTVLHHSGLVDTLNWLTRQMDEQFGLKVELGVHVDRRFESEPLKLFLFRAIQELLFNIVKHAGVKNAQVDLSSTADGQVITTVSDRGCGFEPDSLKTAAVQAGFGLLSLQERASYIGGSLMIDSAPGRGSRFILTTPAHLARVVETQGLPIDLPSDTCSGSPICEKTSSTRVILVDDHQVMRQGLLRLLNGQPGLEVVGEAADGRQGLELVRRLKPDLVLMDISMPVMDGIEATRHIKAEMPQVRVIGLSMHDDSALNQTMHQAGADSFMNKTASLSELLKAIYTVIHKDAG